MCEYFFRSLSVKVQNIFFKGIFSNCQSSFHFKFVKSVYIHFTCTPSPWKRHPETSPLQIVILIKKKVVCWVLSVYLIVLYKNKVSFHVMNLNHPHHEYEAFVIIFKTTTLINYLSIFQVLKRFIQFFCSSVIHRWTAKLHVHHLSNCKMWVHFLHNY